MMSLLKHAAFHKYFANTSWLMLERILRVSASFLVGIYVARYLGPELFGRLSYAMSLAGFFSVLAMLGLDHTVVRDLVKNTAASATLLGTAFGLKLAGSLLALLLIAAVLPFTSNSAQENYLVLIIAVGILFQPFAVIDLHFQARVQSRYVVHAQFVQIAVSSLAKLYLVWTGAALQWFAVVAAADGAVFALGLLLVYLRTGNTFRQWHFATAVARQLLRDAWPLLLSAFAISLYMKIDQVMIKEMLGAEAVGQYAVAVRLSEAWYFIPVAITASLFPAIILVREKSEQRYHQQLQALFDGLVWLAILIALPMTFFSTYIVEMLFGAQYSQAGDVLAIHMWAAVFVFLGCALGRSFVVENRQTLNFYRNLSGLATNIVLNFLLIPVLGIKGAALATLVSYSVSTYLILPLFNDGRRQFILASKSLFPLRRLSHRKSYD